MNDEEIQPIDLTNPFDDSQPDDSGGDTGQKWYAAHGTEFAHAKDLEEYRKAKASGASESEALSVGDNGVGKWGDNTTQSIPMAAINYKALGLTAEEAKHRVGEAWNPETGERHKFVVADAGPNGRFDMNPKLHDMMGGQDGKVQFTLLPEKASPQEFRDQRIAHMESVLGAREKPAMVNTSLPTEPNRTGQFKNIRTIDDTAGGSSEADTPTDTSSPDEAETSPTEESDTADSGGTAATPATRSEKVTSGVRFPSPKGATIDSTEGPLIHWSNGVTGNSATGSTYFTDKASGVTYRRGADLKTYAITPKVAKVSKPTRDPSSGKWYDMSDPNNVKEITIPGGISNQDIDPKDPFKGISDASAANVKMLANLDIPLTTLGRGGISNPKIADLLARASIVNPLLNASDYDKQRKMKLDYSSGKSFAQIKSLNNAISHLSDLREGIDKLPNGETSTTLNAVRKTIREQFGDKSYEKFSTALSGVSTEVPTVIKGSSATVPDIQEWKNQFHATKTKGQLHESLNETLSLLATRANNLRNEYKAATGMEPPAPIIDPDTRKHISEMKGEKFFGELINDKAAPASNSAPADVATPEQVPTFTSKDGTTVKLGQIVYNPTTGEPGRVGPGGVVLKLQ